MLLVLLHTEDSLSNCGRKFHAHFSWGKLRLLYPSVLCGLGFSGFVFGFFSSPPEE